MNEQELRESDAPWPKSEKELTAYIDSLVSQQHDYGTCVYAVSLSALAAFRYAASKLGITGFQAGCADMDIIRRTRGYKGPYMLVNGENALYPQYNIPADVAKFLEESRPWLAKMAAENLASANGELAHPDVIAHWQKLVAAVAPVLDGAPS